MNRPRPVLRPFRSKQYVICVQVGDARYKVAQLMFSRSDGSLFVQFPYYRHTDGLLAIATLEAHGSTLDLTDGGRITSHLVKYAHHPDGEAHFSQTGKVLTRVRRRAAPLDEIDGHCFTIQVHGLDGFAPLDRALFDMPPTKRRTIISFLFESERPGAVKIVGRLHGADAMLSTAARRLSAAPAVIGPIVATEDAQGQLRPAFLVSTLSGQPGERRLLMLSSASRSAIFIRVSRPRAPSSGTSSTPRHRRCAQGQAPPASSWDSTLRFARSCAAIPTVDGATVTSGFARQPRLEGALRGELRKAPVCAKSTSRPARRSWRGPLARWSCPHAAVIDAE